MEESLLLKGSLFLLSISITTIVSYYLLKWLRSDIKLLFLESGDMTVMNGRSQVDNELFLLVEKVEFKGKTCKALRLVRFMIFNNDSRSLKGNAKFVFVATNGDAIPTASVIDIDIKSSPPTNDIVTSKRNDITNVGPGFTLTSSLPGKSQLDISIALKIDEFPALANTRVMLKKIARAEEKLKPKKSAHTITLSVYKFFIWMTLTALTYSVFWLLINIILGNYSTGANIVDWMLKKLIGQGFIP